MGVATRRKRTWGAWLDGRVALSAGNSQGGRAWAGGIALCTVGTRNRGCRVTDKWAWGHSNEWRQFELGLNANSNEFKQVQIFSNFD
jgi:hypothetical protein